MLADVALIDWNKLPTHWSSVRVFRTSGTEVRCVCVWAAKELFRFTETQRFYVRWRRTLACKKKNLKLDLFSRFIQTFVHSQLQLNKDLHNWLNSFKLLPSKNIYWDPATACFDSKFCRCILRHHMKLFVLIYVLFQYWEVFKQRALTHWHTPLDWQLDGPQR